MHLIFISVSLLCSRLYKFFHYLHWWPPKSSSPVHLHLQFISSTPSNMQSDQLQCCCLKSLLCHYVFKILHNITQIHFWLSFFHSLGRLTYPNVEEAVRGLLKPILLFTGTRQDAQCSLRLRCGNVIKFLVMKWKQKWHVTPLSYTLRIGYIIFHSFPFLLTGIWGNRFDHGEDDSRRNLIASVISWGLPALKWLYGSEIKSFF